MKTFIIGLVSLMCLGCNNKRSWNDCPKNIHPDPEDGTFVSLTKGTVVMPEGETCKVEEVHMLHTADEQCEYPPYNYDDSLKCKYCKPYETIFIRRLVCPRGQTVSTILYTLDKFHRELVY